jgi:hypothetical protein
VTNHDQPIQRIKNVCTHCSVGCTVIAEVQNGVWVGQEPAWESPINRGTHCAKGASVRELVHGDRPTVEALADVVRAVATHRSIGAEIHPLNQLGASRLLRSRVIAQPALVDPTIAALVAAEPPLPRTNLKDQVPCVATEVGGSRIVVCSTGVDLEVVAFAGDAAARHGADGVIIAAPARDVLDIQQRLASLLVVPTRFAAVASATSSS